MKRVLKGIDLEKWTSKLKRIEDKVERLALLSRLSQILNSSLEQQEVRKRAMESATQLMKAQVGSLLLIDEKREKLYFEVALGDKGEAVKTTTLNIGEGIAGWVAQKGKPLIVNQPEGMPVFIKRMDGRRRILRHGI